MATFTYTAYIEFDPETGTYFGSIPAVPGAFTQADTLEELRLGLQEALALVLDEWAERGWEIEPERFVGTEVVEISR